MHLPPNEKKTSKRLQCGRSYTHRLFLLGKRKAKHQVFLTVTAQSALSAQRRLQSKSKQSTHRTTGREIKNPRLKLKSELTDYTMGSQHEKWTNKSDKSKRRRLDMLSAFENGDFHDCTFRVGCDLLKSSNSRVRTRCYK
jgi:hypothetical protein